MEKSKRGLTGYTADRPNWPSSRPTYSQQQQQTTLDLVKTSRPVQLLILCTASLIVFLFLPARDSLSSSARAVLASSDWHDPAWDRAHGRVPTTNNGKTVDNYSNKYGLSSKIDPLQPDAFNPSILVLPDSVGENYRKLLVDRGHQPREMIDGMEIWWSQVFGCFLVEDTREKMGLSFLRREGELVKLDLPAEHKVDYPRCHEALFSHFIGAEDPRLFLTNDGQPLMIYSQTASQPNVCRALFLIDARSVMPGLSEAMSKGGWNAPVVFKEQTLLLREGQNNVEKNWSPFLGENDELFVHVNLIPQEIYKYETGKRLTLLTPNPPATNCLNELAGVGRDSKQFHHSTPLLRVTLCRRGECVPDIHNTVLFAFIHIKFAKPRMFYEKRIVTWNVTAPYEYVSVSKPIQYTGTNQMDAVFTTSMSWDHPQTEGGLGLNHGFLDEVLVTSFGVRDETSHYSDLLARDLLTDHQMCGSTKAGGGLL